MSTTPSPDAPSAGSSSTVDSQREVHFLVLVHGMWGNVKHLSECARIIQETKKDLDDGERQLEVLVAETNQEESTYDGFDWGGERVADEVEEAISKIEQSGRTVARFSVTGYSLGGLIARYMLGVLYQRGFFDKHQPCNFNTFATPHIGLPRYPNWISKLGSVLGPRILSRSGEQFYAVDHWSPRGRPLLEVMADPDRIFYKALALFPHITIYANAVNDRTVPYVTSAIELEDPFINVDETGLQPVFDEKYKPLITSWQLPSTPPTRGGKPALLSKQWFKDLKDHKPTAPPILQFGFPGNLLIYIVLPIVFPAFFSLALIRLTLSSRSSQKRIKLLEKEETYRSRLVHIVAEMEKQVEDTLVDVLNDPGPSADIAASAPSESVPLAAAGKSKKKEPVITETQRKIVEWLNTLPNLQKQRAFIHPVLNAHAIIVSRDVKRFPQHREGEGVIRHWADHFEL